MAELIKPRLSVITKEGECQLNITVDLNINLNTGDMQVTSHVKQEEEKEEKPVWEIPTFTSKEKVKFGKKENL